MRYYVVDVKNREVIGSIDSHLGIRPIQESFDKQGLSYVLTQHITLERKRESLQR